MRLQCDYLFYHFRAIFSILFFFVNERTGAAPTLFLADGYWCVDRTCLCTQQSDMTILDDCTCKRIWCECFDFSLSLSPPLLLCFSVIPVLPLPKCDWYWMTVAFLFSNLVFRFCDFPFMLPIAAEWPSNGCCFSTWNFGGNFHDTIWFGSGWIGWLKIFTKWHQINESAHFMFINLPSAMRRLGPPASHGYFLRKKAHTKLLLESGDETPAPPTAERRTPKHNHSLLIFDLFIFIQFPEWPKNLFCH